MYITIDGQLPADMFSPLDPDTPVTVIVQVNDREWSATGRVTAFSSQRGYTEDVDDTTGTTVITPARTIDWTVTLSGESDAQVPVRPRLPGM